MDIKNSWLCTKPIAHRGLHNDEFPENSLGAFDNAAKHGFPIELDVHEMDDGTLVVFHDECLSRMTGRDGYIANLKKEDLADIRLLKSGEKTPTYTEENIPTWDEVLECVAGRTPILIEIKNDHKVGGLESSLLKSLKNYSGEFAVQSFNPYSVEYFKKNAPDITRGLLSSFFKDSDLSRFKKYMLKRLMLFKTAGPQFIAYQWDNLPNRWVSRRKLPVLAWTVRSLTDWDTVREYCDNIIFQEFVPELSKK